MELLLILFLGKPLWMWLLFLALVVALLVFDLGVLNNHFGYFVRRIQVWIFQDFIRRLSRIDISPAQFSVLLLLLIGTVIDGKPVEGEKSWLLSPCGVFRSPINRGGLLHVG